MAKEPEFKWKQCLIIRADIKMSCGKRCAQLAHAAIGAYESCDKNNAEKMVQRRDEKSHIKGALPA